MVGKMYWIDEISGLDGMNAGLTQQWLDCWNTTADWHESCATSSIGSVCRSGSSSSSAPWCTDCTVVYTTLLPGTSVTTASRSRMLPLAVNYDPQAAIKLSFPATTRAPSAVGPSLSLAQRSGTHCQTSSATHRYWLTVSVASLKHSRL